MGGCEFDIFVAHHADTERIHKGITSISSVKYHFSADIRKSQAVTVSADSGHNSGEDTSGVNGIGRTKAQRIHNGDRARAHSQNIAHDSANTGSSALVGLYK